MSMQQVYGWLQNTAFFIIFMTAVLNCLPEVKYRRYVRFFLGMVLLIVIGRPMIGFFHLDRELSVRLGEAKIMQEAKSSQETMLEVAGLQKEYLLTAYEQEIEQQVWELLLEQEVNPVEVRAKFHSVNENADENLKLHSLFIRAKQKSDTLYQSEEKKNNEAFTKKIREIKEKLAEVYQIDEAAITIQNW